MGRPGFGPSDRLIAMFRACSQDPTEVIKTRLGRMLHIFLQHHSNSEGKERIRALVKCCCEARIWYYRILEAIVSQKKERPDISDISVRWMQGVLEDDLIQRSLVACCLQITVTLNTLHCDFPELLQIFELTSYDLWKVIKLVMRAEVCLHHAVVTHLTKMEEDILESLAWASDSPLWDQIRANEGHLPACQQVIPPTQLEDPEKTNRHPDPDLPQEDASLGAESSSPSAVNRPQRGSFFNLFVRMVYYVMGRRLRELCSTLNISDELRLKIWTCFEYSLVNCTGLMADRHLDQLLMCAIYITAKITKKEIPFKLIMKRYKSQPCANKSVCKNVLISGGVVEKSPTGNDNGNHSSATLTPNTPSTHHQKERGNLIDFYNQVYTTKMQRFAEQFAPSSREETPPLSPYPRQGKASPRRYQVSSNYQIYISPYNRETTPTPTHSLTYTFNSSPSERLHEINNMIRNGGSPSRRRGAVTLDPDGEEGDDRPPAARRLCLDGESVLQRRLRNVVNDRVARRNQDQDQD